MKGHCGMGRLEVIHPSMWNRASEVLPIYARGSKSPLSSFNPELSLAFVASGYKLLQHFMGVQSIPPLSLPVVTHYRAVVAGKTFECSEKSKDT